ncbi:MAG TPA: hypothetical protein VLB27_03380 [candidate division Zixibacteria bacterium]|nr:hypothetical protein [candidate division Zixibacteria bacterium]
MKERFGAFLVLVAALAAAYFLYTRGGLRDPQPGEIRLTGQVARGPGRNCWILNANTGERFQFIGDNLGRLQTVGARATVIARPELDKTSDCSPGRIITVMAYKIDELPNYNSR